MEWYPTQHSFNGGEVSPRMLSRVEAEIYKQACLRMENFMPRMQGPAVRSPGTAYIESLGATGNARLVPYHTINDIRSLIVFTDGAVRFLTGLDEAQIAGRYAPISAVNRLPFQVINNEEFDGAGASPEEDWVLDPADYIGGQGYEGGCWYVKRDYSGVLRMSCREWKFPNQDKNFAKITQAFELPYDSSTIKFDYRFTYLDNPGEEGNDYTFTVKVGTTPGADDVWSLDLSNKALGIYQEIVTVNITYTAPETLYLTIELTATEYASTPGWELDRFKAFIDGPELPVEPPIVVDPSAEYYTSDELPDLQFVQSPYDNKPIVLVHPNHPPQEILYDPNTAQYEFRPITFTTPPAEWVAGNYPSCCTSYQGRLILAATPAETETVWGSRPGLWYDFQQYDNTPTDYPAGAYRLYTPDSSIQFTSIFRSPIKWVYGQRDLVIGAEDLEYAVFAEQGLLTPGNIDVREVDAHGTIGVQPAGIGRNVAFAAERGRRLRVTRLNNLNEGWISPDATVLADHLVTSGIKRVVRMRNPHQMIVCLLNSGDLAIYHMDEMAGVNGWSRYHTSGTVQDIVVSPVSDGTDALFLITTRNVDGVNTQLIEAVFNWVYDREWQYMASSVVRNYETPVSTITDLAHLNGNNVYVIAEGNLIGTFPVVNGEVKLEDAAGNPGGLNALKRYANISLRTIGSTRPIINGVRPPDRLAVTPMNSSGSFTFVEDVEVANLGSNELAIIRVEETVPFAVDILSVSGKLTSNKL
ncbi:MAG: phage tail protein [Planctomycetota bacterium]|jgi:hypothetical protein